jgi:replication fork protection complex subunit Tof1/Swi1
MSCLTSIVRQILTLVIAQRQRIIEETDAKDNDDLLEDDNETNRNATLKLDAPSNEALAKLTDYCE